MAECLHDLAQHLLPYAGMKRNPKKANWLSAGGSYAVHLMPAMTAEDGTLPVDAARHFALQVNDLNTVVARLLEAGEKPYQLALDNPQPRHVQDAQDSLSYGLGTVFVNDPDNNVVEFIQLDRGIFAQCSHLVEE